MGENVFIIQLGGNPNRNRYCPGRNPMNIIQDFINSCFGSNDFYYTPEADMIDELSGMINNLPVNQRYYPGNQYNDPAYTPESDMIRDFSGTQGNLPTAPPNYANNVFVPEISDQLEFDKFSMDIIKMTTLPPYGQNTAQGHGQGNSGYTYTNPTGQQQPVNQQQAHQENSTHTEKSPNPAQGWLNLKKESATSLANSGTTKPEHFYNDKEFKDAIQLGGLGGGADITVNTGNANVIELVGNVVANLGEAKTTATAVGTEENDFIFSKSESKLTNIFGDAGNDQAIIDTRTDEKNKADYMTGTDVDPMFDYSADPKIVELQDVEKPTIILGKNQEADKKMSWFSGKIIYNIIENGKVVKKIIIHGKENKPEILKETDPKAQEYLNKINTNLENEKQSQ